MTAPTASSMYGSAMPLKGHDSVKQRLAQFRSEKAAEQQSQTAAPQASTTDVTKPRMETLERGAEKRTTSRSKADVVVPTTELLWWSRLPLWVKVSAWVASAVFAEYVGELRAFLVIAGLIVVYAYTRETTRRPGELSAYSVFNKGQKKIDGTFDYADFEKSLRSGGPI
eukprot:m.12253 g.12253  ORF g.12253 m.12253 type:complete len:169 (-) comp7715_c0_seq1:252-758(-)